MDAYRYAAGIPDANGNLPPIPPELADIGYIRTFGVKAVYGRDVLRPVEIRSMILAENVHDAYLSRRHYKDRDGVSNWAEWAESNPGLAALLAEVEKMVSDAD